VKLNGAALKAGQNVSIGLSVALRSRRLEYRAIELVRGLKIALEDPSLLDTWRSRPGAFADAIEAKVHPNPDRDRAGLRMIDDSYRQVTNHPEWSEIRPGVIV
jgi:hypothetical protein